MSSDTTAAETEQTEDARRLAGIRASVGEVQRSDNLPIFSMKSIHRLLSMAARTVEAEQKTVEAEQKTVEAQKQAQEATARAERAEGED